MILAVIASVPIKEKAEQLLERNQDNGAVYLIQTFGPKIFALLIFLLSYMKLVSGSFNPFIYFQF